MASDVYIEMKLEVLGNDTLIVPGCEPESSVTSPTLSRFRQCTHSTVKLKDALEAIPGSRIEYQINSGHSNGVRKRWFVLPQINLECPCVNHDDYYKILRELTAEEPVPDDYSDCEVLDQGYCPPKNYKDIPAPAVKPYVKEGEFAGGLSSLIQSPNMWEIDPIIES